LLNEFAIPSQSCLEAGGQEMRDMCLNLDRLDGIHIEMGVEEREPGIAVVVLAIDLDRGTILAHSAAFTHVAKTKILAGNNCNQ
jgi:hypothetical protein